MENTQKLKLGIQKVQMDSPIIDYVRISNKPLAQPQRTIYTQFQLKNFFCLILQEFCYFPGTWDLRYLILLRI